MCAGDRVSLLMGGGADISVLDVLKRTDYKNICIAHKASICSFILEHTHVSDVICL
jgi:hypothetical protein